MIKGGYLLKKKIKMKKGSMVYQQQLSYYHSVNIWCSSMLGGKDVDQY